MPFDPATLREVLSDGRPGTTGSHPGEDEALLPVWQIIRQTHEASVAMLAAL